MRALLGLLSIGVAALASCGEGSTISPVAKPKAGAVGPKDDTGSSGGTVAPPPRKREVFTRNPFGGPAGNLLADGDFELSTLPEGHTAQLGWRAFSGNGSSEQSVSVETGGICRTGLRCAVMTDGVLLFARGAAAPHGAGHVASVWTRPPPEVACDDVAKFVLVGCDTFDPIGTLAPVADGPDATGWCEYRGAVGAQQSAVCLYVDSTLDSDQIALVDSAKLLADDGSAGTAAEAWAPPREMSERMNAVRERVRGHRFGRPLGWDDEGFPLRPGIAPRPRAR